MSCTVTVMYQPYAMSYSSSCDRTVADNLKKSFKFPHAPSPPESSHSNASSAYSSPGSTTGGLASHNASLLGSLSLLPPQLHSPSAAIAAASLAASSHSNNNGASGSGQRRPLTPSCASSGGGGGSSASATITSASQQQQQHHHHSHPHHAHSSHSHSHHHHHHHQHHSSSSSASSTSSSSVPAHHHHQLHRSGSGGSSSSVTPSATYPLHTSLNLSSSSNTGAAPSATASSSRDLSHHGPSSSSSSSSTSTSSHHAGGFAGSSGTKSSSVSATVTSAAAGNGELSDDESPGRSTSNNEAAGVTGDESEGSSTRAQYLSANCILYVNYDGNAARVVEEHFNRALSAAYSGEKSSKSLPMSTRNFPASFWNSNYQPAKPSALTTYGAADFYGTAMDYSAAIPSFAHHHPQADPWHYPLGTHHHHHQSYHHRPSDIAYSPMTSTSRFNAAQYGSFLFPSTSAAAAAARFPGIPTPGQCSVKGDAAHHWAAAGGRYDGWSDLHLAADYSAAAAHYSNMTAAAGLDFETHYLQSS